jgi:Mn-containing catalase
MFVHDKRLQYTARLTAPNAVLAHLLLEQFGGPQGELAAACRYFTQAVSEHHPGRRDMLFGIAIDELTHLELIGSVSGKELRVFGAMASRTASARETDLVTATRAPDRMQH